MSCCFDWCKQNPVRQSYHEADACPPLGDVASVAVAARALARLQAADSFQSMWLVSPLMLSGALQLRSMQAGEVSVRRRHD